MSIVIGSDSVSAFLKSSLKALSSALLALASPNWPTTTPGCSAFTRSTAATTGSIAFDVWASSPRTSNVTSAERPSLRDLVGVAVGVGRRDLGDARLAAARRRPRRRRRGGPPGRGRCRPGAPGRGRSRRRSSGSGPRTASRPRPESPTRVSWLELFIPTSWPATTQATTKPSQPRIAVLRWRALQRPARAAKVRLVHGKERLARRASVRHGGPRRDAGGLSPPRRWCWDPRVCSHEPRCPTRSRPCGTTRERTLALVAHLPDAELERQVHPLMSPLVWDLAHIAAYEDLWLCHRHGGEPLLHPDLAATYDAFETPRAVRGEIELLDARRRPRATSRTCARARSPCSSPGRDRPGPARARAAPRAPAHRDDAPGDEPRRPAAAGRAAVGAGGRAQDGWVAVPAGPFALGAGAEGFAYDNERPPTASTWPPSGSPGDP